MYMFRSSDFQCFFGTPSTTSSSLLLCKGALIHSNFRWICSQTVDEKIRSSLEVFGTKTSDWVKARVRSLNSLGSPETISGGCGGNLKQEKREEPKKHAPLEGVGDGRTAFYKRMRHITSTYNLRRQVHYTTCQNLCKTHATYVHLQYKFITNLSEPIQHLQTT